MAHYAILDENNIVTQVIVGKDENEPLPDGYTSWEQYYGGKRTSYNAIGGKRKNPETNEITDEPGFRKNYAAIGFKYDEEWDAFSPPRPFPSWKFNYETFLWEPPIPKPDVKPGFIWKWGEINQEWVAVPLT